MMMVCIGWWEVDRFKMQIGGRIDRSYLQFRCEIGRKRKKIRNNSHFLGSANRVADAVLRIVAAEEGTVTISQCL